MQYPDIIHHGATRYVTGSCHQLCLDPYNSVLIDCGADSGVDASYKVPDVISASLKALVITHVHNDHVGRLPQFMAGGFKGPVLCSEASARLLPLVMEDVLKQGNAHDTRQVTRFLDELQGRIIALPFGHWFTLIDTPQLQCRLRLQRAGHILGSAYIECALHYVADKRDVRVVFSGDLGACHTPILRSLRSPEHADILVLESTYGNRLHADRSRRQDRLEQVIDQALRNGGTVLLPAFSIGRTQELLYELEDILRRKALLSPSGEAHNDLPVDWARLPVILDSPLASRFTRVYREFHADWDQQAQQRLAQGRKPLGFDQLITVDSHAEHVRVVNYLAGTARPAIVIAGHGMCAGGRIVNYLKAMLGDARHHVVFVGYQARGTPGRVLQSQAATHVELDKALFEIRAGICTVPGYSAHADQQGLVSFVTGMQRWPRQIRLVHGELPARKALARRFAQIYGVHDCFLDMRIPEGAGG